MKKKVKKITKKQFKTRLNKRIKELEDVFDAVFHAEDMLNQLGCYLREVITELKVHYTES
jgi:hypothetical protein